MVVVGPLPGLVPGFGVLAVLVPGFGLVPVGLVPGFGVLAVLVPGFGLVPVGLVPGFGVLAVLVPGFGLVPVGLVPGFGVLAEVPVCGRVPLVPFCCCMPVGLVIELGCGLVPDVGRVKLAFLVGTPEVDGLEFQPGRLFEAVELGRAVCGRFWAAGRVMEVGRAEAAGRAEEVGRV